MPDGRLERTRLAYRIDFEAGDGPMRPTVRCQPNILMACSDEATRERLTAEIRRGIRCICGSKMADPHAPECYRLKVEREIEPDFLTGSDPGDETLWGV